MGMWQKTGRIAAPALCAPSLLAGASLMPVLAGVWCGHDLMDDSYITLTYAKNLAAGEGFVYNHPPATLGTTTPLLTVLAAVGGALLPVDVETAAVWLTVLCWVAVPWTLYAGRRALGLGVWPATILGVIFLGSTRPVLGHEFYLFQALFFIAMVLFMQQRLIWCGAVIGLLFLTRGEGLLLLPLCGAWLLGVWAAHAPRDGRALVRDGLRLGGGFAVPVLPWCGYALWTFGRILPQTLDAKQVQGALGEYPTFTEQLPVWLGAWWFWDSTLMRPVQAGMWALALLGVGYAVWRARPWRFLAGWCVLYTAGYALLGVQAYWWYQLPLWFAWILFIGLGCVAALGIARAVPRYRTAATAVVAVGVAGVLGVHLALTGYKAWTYQGDWRAPLYRDVAAWLHEHSAPGATVAYGEVGYLGYYTDNRIVDLWGLVSPGLLDDAAAGDFTATFLAEPPDYYLDVGVARYAHLLAHPDLAAQYAPVHTFEDPNHDLRATLYARR